jgi:hypothetical protein
LTTIRYLVESYYDAQKLRMGSAGRIRAAIEAEAPADLMAWLTDREGTTESAIKSMLDQYTTVEKTGMGAWAREIVGIGPVISAGLLAYIDMKEATNPSKIWRFFGLDPTSKGLPGQKRPWNANAKVLAWKIGDSFMKFHNNPQCFYGKIYAERKALEVARNESGQFAAIAAQTLIDRTFKSKKVKAVYQSGKLPDGRIELRARRVAVKMFLVHWWMEAWRRRFKTEPPKPYIIGRDGHEHFIEAPHASAVTVE